MFRALDLFCSAGGATKGLQRAGAYVTGIDLKPQPRYCGDHFIQADALHPPVDLRDFDFIWASPPCQDSSIASTLEKSKGRTFPQLIPATRKMLRESGVPYAIENVVGAPLESAVKLCGTSFDLRVIRHRLFECSFPILTPPCDHTGKKIGAGYFSVAGGSGRWRVWGAVQEGISKGTVAQWREAMGIDWMTRYELTQAIPPAYSEYIARAWLSQRLSLAA